MDRRRALIRRLAPGGGRSRVCGMGLERGPGLVRGRHRGFERRSHLVVGLGLCLVRGLSRLRGRGLRRLGRRRVRGLDRLSLRGLSGLGLRGLRRLGRGPAAQRAGQPGAHRPVGHAGPGRRRADRGLGRRRSRRTGRPAHRPDPDRGRREAVDALCDPGLRHPVLRGHVHGRGGHRLVRERRGPLLLLVPAGRRAVLLGRVRVRVLRPAPAAPAVDRGGSVCGGTGLRGGARPVRSRLAHAGGQRVDRGAGDRGEGGVRRARRPVQGRRQDQLGDGAALRVLAQLHRDPVPGRPAAPATVRPIALDRGGVQVGRGGQPGVELRAPARRHADAAVGDLHDDPVGQHPMSDQHPAVRGGEGGGVVQQLRAQVHEVVHAGGATTTLRSTFTRSTRE